VTGRFHETVAELEIPFHDCDALGVVWHGHYYKYMEIARCKMLTPLGLDGAELLATGHRMYVIETKCRYAQPLRYRDQVRVTAWLKDWENRIMVSFEIHNLTAGVRAARGHTALAMTDADGTLLLETPRALLDRILR
jgi:acyl-CoA thioester hydrolase